MNPDFGAFNQNGWDKINDIKVDGNQLVMTTSEVYAPFMSYVAGTRIAPKSAIDAGIDSFKQDLAARRSAPDRSSSSSGRRRIRSSSTIRRLLG